jgi:hypothetical protein
MAQPGEPYDPNPPIQPAPGYPPAPGQYPAPYAGQPHYPQYAQYPGYPPPPYPGYPPPPYGPSRPGVATAANVLGYVAAGLLIAGGLLLFFGASIVNGLDQLDQNSHSVVTAELVLDGVLNLVAAGLLIAGAVSFAGRNSSGRVMLSVGSGIVIGESVYWIVRSSGDATFWALLFAALVIVSLSLAWSSSSNRWIRGSAP